MFLPMAISSSWVDGKEVHTRIREGCNCLKATLVILNIFFLLIAVVLVLACLLILLGASEEIEILQQASDTELVTSQQSSQLSASLIDDGCYLLLVGAFFLAIFSLVGLFGAAKGWIIFLFVYLVVLGLTLFIQIVAIALIGAFQSQILEETSTQLIETLKCCYDERDNERGTELLDMMQRSLKCCGVESGADYANHSVKLKASNVIPFSCCKRDIAGNIVEVDTCTTVTVEEESYYNIGCREAGEAFIEENSGGMIGGCVVIMLIEVAAIVCSVLLIKKIRRSRGRVDSE